MDVFVYFCPKSPKLKFWILRCLTGQNGRRHTDASYSRQKSIWFCVCMLKNIHGICAKWSNLLDFMDSTIQPWQKNRPSTLIRTDSDPKPPNSGLSKSGQVSYIVVQLYKALEKSVGRKVWGQNFIFSQFRWISNYFYLIKL